MLKCYNRKFSCSCGVTHIPSLYFSFRPFPLSLSFQKRSPSICLSSHLYSYIPCSYLYSCLLPAKFSGIFFFILSVSSLPLSWNSDFWGVFVLFRLSHMHSMWHRLGENPLINVEVKNLQSSYVFWKFPVVPGISWKPYVDYLCTFLWVRFASCLFHGNYFPARRSPPSGYLGWSSFFSSIVYCPLGLPSSIHGRPNLFPLTQLLLGLKVWMRTLALPTLLLLFLVF